MGKYSELLGGSRSVMVPTVAVLIGLALFGPFSNKNKFIIGVTGFTLLIVFSLLKPYHDYKYACYYDSKLRKACDTVLLSAPTITATILVGISFFNMSDSQILEAIGLGMISAVAFLCCYSIIDDIIPYPQKEFEQTLTSDIMDEECEITSLF